MDATPPDDTPEPDPTANDPVFCSFCGNNREQAWAIVSGPGCFICSTCWMGIAALFGERLDCPPDAAYTLVKRKDAEIVQARIQGLMEWTHTDELIEIGGTHGGKRTEG